MNTLGDIEKLVGVVSGTFARNGLVMVPELTKPFWDCIHELIKSAYFHFCVTSEQQHGFTNADYPPKEEMCLALKAADQSKSLSRSTQARYYCAVAHFLTAGSGGADPEQARGQEWMSASALINGGLLACFKGK